MVTTFVLHAGYQRFEYLVGVNALEVTVIYAVVNPTLLALHRRTNV